MKKPHLACRLGCGRLFINPQGRGRHETRCHPPTPSRSVTKLLEADSTPASSAPVQEKEHPFPNASMDSLLSRAIKAGEEQLNDLRKQIEAMDAIASQANRLAKNLELLRMAINQFETDTLLQ
jgi:hypothetical protein